MHEVAAQVVALDRSDVAGLFGVDETVRAASAQWAAEADRDPGRPDIVVEAVGHQVATVRDAVQAVAAGGQVASDAFRQAIHPAKGQLKIVIRRA